MATTTAESSDVEPASSPGSHPKINIPKTLDETTPLINYAVQQAQLYQKAFNDALESAFEASKSRLSHIRSTSSAHFHQALGSLLDLKSEYSAYEDLLFGKIKEGILVAASRPIYTCGATAALGFLLLKRPRRFLYYSTLHLFVSEEALINRANKQVKELRQSIEFLKAESDKLEKRALHAEEEFLRGRTKLRQAGKQIGSVIQSAYKIEREARGMQNMISALIRKCCCHADTLTLHFARREASHFRSQVSKFASEAKRERSTMTKEVSKISNYGISV